MRRSPVAIWADTPQEQLHRASWKRVPRSVFLKWLLKRVDLVFGSGEPARRVLTKMGTPPANIRDFQFAVDIDKPMQNLGDSEFLSQAEAFRAALSFDKSATVFGMSGTIDFSKKAQDIGLRAFAKCAKKCSCRMLIAGSGPEINRLKELSSELGVSDRVHFLGWLEPHVMDCFYDSIDVLLHPANYDPFPLVVIESMSWGKPVIGTNTSGSVEERVSHGINGFIVNPGDFDTMASYMEMMAVNGHLLGSAKIEARKTAQKWPIGRLVEILKREIPAC